jgi:hypothetical protein
MGRYLDIIRRKPERCEQSEISEKTPSQGCVPPSHHNQQDSLVRLNRFSRIFQELERRCPLYIDPPDWQQAVEDGRRFLASWGDQAQTLGWTTRDLFGLAPTPDKPAAQYRRLSRYDATGLIWLLQGRPVVVLTEETAAIETTHGVVTYYRRNKPAFGPLGDSLDHMGPTI